MKVDINRLTEELYQLRNQLEDNERLMKIAEAQVSNGIRC